MRDYEIRSIYEGDENNKQHEIRSGKNININNNINNNEVIILMMMR